MVQKSLQSIVLGILLRVVLLCLTAVAAFYTSPIALNFLENVLGYQAPDFFDYSLDDILDSFILSFVFLIGVFFVSLCKKIDYALVGIFFILMLFVFYGYSALIYIGIIA